MKHLGDITQIDGHKIEPVDCITFGSPCTDLSVAGRREGLAGKQSGLFIEAVRVIKEMREATNGRYPRFAVWENVPGAFSSNGGEDFRTVLEEFIRLKEPTATIPKPNGKWSKAGTITGDGYSLAWRLFDAQFWGVPQRRQRIALVMDFGGQRAPEVLFESEGLPGYSEPGISAWKGSAVAPEASTTPDDSGRCLTVSPSQILKTRSVCEDGGKGTLIQTDKCGTTSTLQDQTPRAYGLCSMGSGAMMSNNPHTGFYEAETSRTLDLNGGNPCCNQGGIAVVACQKSFGEFDIDEVATTLIAHESKQFWNVVISPNDSPSEGQL